MRFLFACGGTAGHINPALALAEKLKKIIPECEIMFVGSGREMENRLIPAEGYRLENITITGFSRSLSLKGIASNFITAKNLLISQKQSYKILDKFNPDVVIGTGGYVCYPVLKAASKRKIPTILHESNAVPGLTTKMLSKVVNEMLVAFEGAKENYKRKDNIKVVGTPVRGQFELLTKSEAKKLIGITDRPLVISFWGSLGASYMNAVMKEFIRLNTKEKLFYHIHATGGGAEGEAKMKNALLEEGVQDYNVNTDIRAYINNMGVLMRAADLVMCRAGASTIAELTLVGVPSILIPSPNVTNNHQEANAREVEKAGAAKMILEKDCTGESLYNTVKELINSKDSLKTMSENAAKLGAVGSTDRILEIILSYVK